MPLAAGMVAVAGSTVGTEYNRDDEKGALPLLRSPRQGQSPTTKVQRSDQG
jgi:hypothetical protein